MKNNFATIPVWLTANIPPKKILVVEDDGSVLSILTNALGKQGFVMLGARDGEEGLQTAFKERPDLILLDIIMPKMDGIDMLKRLRQDSGGKKSR